jgi:hypothetical protein
LFARFSLLLLLQFTTIIPAAWLALLSEVNKHVIPREWLGFFLPHTWFYAPEAFINHTKRLE